MPSRKVLAVVALWIAQAEHPLFENRIFFVPQRNRQADMLLVVAKAADAVFVPTIGLAAGVIVGKEIPRVAIGAVVFAHGAPGPLADVWPPTLPIHLAGVVLDQSSLLGIGCHRSDAPLAHILAGRRLVVVSSIARRIGILPARGAVAGRRCRCAHRGCIDSGRADRCSAIPGAASVWTVQPERACTCRFPALPSAHDRCCRKSRKYSRGKSLAEIGSKRAFGKRSLRG